MENHLDIHARMALEIASLIEGSLEARDESVSDHLAIMARGWAYKLVERLEAEREEVIKVRTPEEILRFAAVIDSVVPVHFGREVAGGD
jgi:hypothetical protein